MRQIIGLGAGGHAKGIIEILQNYPSHHLVGLLDINEKLHRTKLLGIPVLGSDCLIPNLISQGIDHFFIGLGSIGNMHPRRKLYELAQAYHLKPVDAIHPSAIISPSAMVSSGATILRRAGSNPAARIRLRRLERGSRRFTCCVGSDILNLRRRRTSHVGTITARGAVRWVCFGHVRLRFAGGPRCR